MTRIYGSMNDDLSIDVRLEPSLASIDQSIAISSFIDY